MKTENTTLKDHELAADELHQLIGGVSQTDYQCRDTAVDGIAMFRRAMLD